MHPMQFASLYYYRQHRADRRFNANITILTSNLNLTLKARDVPWTAICSHEHQKALNDRQKLLLQQALSADRVITSVLIRIGSNPALWSDAIAGKVGSPFFRKAATIMLIRRLVPLLLLKLKADWRVAVRDTKDPLAVLLLPTTLLLTPKVTHFYASFSSRIGYSFGVRSLRQ